MNPIFCDKYKMGEMMLNNDLEKQYIPKELYASLIDFGWDKGIEAADLVKERWGDNPPSWIAKKCGVVLDDVTGKGKRHFSEYSTNQRLITLYQDVIKKEFIEKEKNHLKTDDYKRIREIFIAHELFHFMESTDERIGYLFQQRKVEMFRLGPFVRRVGQIGRAHV